MTKKGYLGLLVILVLIVLAVWFVFQAPGQQAAFPAALPQTASTTPSRTPTPLLPTIELGGGAHATSTTAGVSVGVALRSGDALQASTTIQVGNDTTAVIHFQDGSQARLGRGSIMTLNEAMYATSTQALGVTMSLTSGRVWSKILDLATPESRWEVQTSNAVATVRGTAFDVRATGKQSSIFTASNKVAVALRDPATKKMLLAQATEVKEGKLLLIGEKEVALAQQKKLKSLSVLDAPSNYVQDSWVTSNTQVDAAFDTRVETLQKENIAPALLRERLREEWERAPTPLLKESSPVAQPVVKETVPTTSSVQPVGEPSTKPAAPVGLEVRTQGLLGETVEGKVIAFRAVLTLTDASTRDVTKSVRWQVVGPIGRFTAPGSFLAALDPAIAETGTGSGSVVAVFRDQASGEEYLGKSPIFKVVVDAAAEGGAAI